MELKPLHFIGESIDVHFDEPLIFEKKPRPPDSFFWQEENFVIVEVISEWHDYRRRGRMAHNMRQTHADSAKRRGSWGVGQDYFRVRTKSGRFFDLYYDRAPKDIDNRKGAWFLDKEIALME